MEKGSGSGQSTMCTPVTNIYKNDQKKHSGLGCLFLLWNFSVQGISKGQLQLGGGQRMGYTCQNLQGQQLILPSFYILTSLMQCHLKKGFPC